jgi:membrane-associated protease RseP (regulator of RpoE activity)
MSFFIYDITLLIVFAIFISIFLYKRRKEIKKEGFLLLYKTSWGIKLINNIGEKHKKLLNFLSYVSVITGFLLMAVMIYLFGKIVWIYIFQSNIVSLVKVPPIMPLLPYVPQIFKLSYLPPFYFIYWIIIIAIVAISHEVSHGIFAVNKDVKIKTTGFGFFPYFLPVFLAAFVELDEKEMEKKKIFPQMAILSAGTFANVIIGILFLIILILFFGVAFSSSGVVFDTYMYSSVGIVGISSINNMPIQNANYETILNSLEEGNNEIIANGEKYLLTKNFLESQTKNEEYIVLYDDAPATRAGLGNIILKINDVEIKSKEKLSEELSKYSPNEKIIVTTFENNSLKDYEITLGENPENKNIAYLGIAFLVRENSGIAGSIVNAFSFKDPNLYYTENFKGAEVIYNLIWWLVLISFSVALINMLPVGIFDGGRFFYLTILAITKSEKKAKKAFSLMTGLFLLLLALTMIFWGINLFR